MAIRYVIKNKRGNYLSGADAFRKDIDKATIWSKTEAKENVYKWEGESIAKVDVQITELPE